MWRVVENLGRKDLHDCNGVIAMDGNISYGRSFYGWDIYSLIANISFQRCSV